MKRKKSSRRLPLRLIGAVLATGLTLSAVWISAGRQDLSGVLVALSDSTWLTRQIIERELAALTQEQSIPGAAVLALAASPTLSAARQAVKEYWAFEKQTRPEEQTPSEEREPPVIVQPTPEAQRSQTENGVPAKTIVPSGEGYTTVGLSRIANSTDYTLDAQKLGQDYKSLLQTGAAPSVLILHTHGSEAYTMAPGEEYVATSYCRSIDNAYNVVRIGEEIARVLTEAGLSVLHDRTLHDYPKYSGAYDRSLVTAQEYLTKYPSLVYILDIHRDAIEDAQGNAYKLICEERPDTAQLSLVVGSDGGGLPHPQWQKNLHLATSVQQCLLEQYPTLMRPITLRNSRYNQHLTPGVLLVEVGAAGNALGEALEAAALFAAGFAQTVLPGVDKNEVK